MSGSAIGKTVPRKESWQKATGTARYVNDIARPGMLYAKLAVSPHAHAKINSIDTSQALSIPGVRAVVTGRHFPVLTGSPLEDRPPLAIDKVRYYGEPVALVVADSEYVAQMAALRIQAEYEPLPIVHSPSQAYPKDAPLIHERLATYPGIETWSAAWLPPFFLGLPGSHAVPSRPFDKIGGLNAPQNASFFVWPSGWNREETTARE